MQEQELSDIKVKLDDEGYLVNFDDWTEEVASALAEREQKKPLSHEQLDILKFMLKFRKKYDVAINFYPSNRIVTQFVKYLTRKALPYLALRPAVSLLMMKLEKNLSSCFFWKSNGIALRFCFVNFKMAITVK